MMKVRKVLFCGALVFAAACSKGSDSPEALMEKSVAMMEEMAKVVEGAGDDCDKMASGVESIAKKYEGDLAKIKKLGEEAKKDKAKAEEFKKMGEKYKDRMEKAMPAMMGMMKCADHPKMKELQSKLRM
jgi:hypothetical protein